MIVMRWIIDPDLNISCMFYLISNYLKINKCIINHLKKKNTYINHCYVWYKRITFDSWISYQ